MDVLILGAGFGGLELAVTLSESVPSDVSVTLVDRNDSFMFGFSKLELLLGRQPRSAISLPYRALSHAGVAFRQEEVQSIDPATRRVVTSGGSYEPDILVVALGADYDPVATPGFVHDGHEFYSPEGAERLHEALTGFRGGSLILAVLGVPFKCPPAPYEGAFLIHEFLEQRGARDATRMHVITPMPSPIPISAPASEAIVAGSVYALGDCADAPVPRAGVFAESAARVVADQIVSLVRRTSSTLRFEGTGTCYIEFGDGLVGRVDANFLSGPAPVAPFVAPSLESADEKRDFARTRCQRWFGL